MVQVQPIPCLPRRLLGYWKVFIAAGLPLALLPLPLIYGTKTASCAYCVLLMAIFWMTEAIPIPITALLPVVLYPMFGIVKSDEICREYLKDSIMVFVGGLLVALAFEYCELHKRIALRVMLATGASLSMLMLGTMVTTAFLSMWMFNTATTAMMVPIIQAVLDELQKSLEQVYGRPSDNVKNEDQDEHVLNNNGPVPENVLDTSDQNRESGDDGHISSPGPVEDKVAKSIQSIRTMFLLSTCYSSNIGGTGVVTGSGTNLVALEFLGDLDPNRHGDYASLTFATWAAFNFVPMVINIFVAWVYLQLVFLGLPPRFKFWLTDEKKKELVASQVFHPELESQIKTMLAKKYHELGGVTLHEVAVAICFVVAVTSWVLHDPRFIPGWSELFHGGPKVSISTATLLIGALFFIVPRNPEFYRHMFSTGGQSVAMKPLLEWDFVQKRFPWGVIILLGGGYALSKGAKHAGLNEMIGESLHSLSHLPPSLLLLCCMTIIAFLTEVTSNTAMASIVVPILLQLSQELDVHPLYLTLPATVTCSYAFMLPVATPPNAIVFSAGNMRILDMIKTGFFMNIACVLVLYVCTNIYGNLFFHFNEYHFIPE